MTPDEDAELRRLEWFTALGAELALPKQVLKQELRAQDRRQEVRQPADRLVVEPDALS